MQAKNKKHWWLRLWVLLIFWTISYIALLTIFTTGSREWQIIDHIYTSLFILTLLIPVTLNDWWLLPKYLRSGKYTTYIALALAIIQGGTYLNMFFFSTLVDILLPDYYFISYYSYSELVIFFTAFVGISTLISLSLDWLILQEDRYRINRLEKERVTAEFKALASQVNPHFLFNSLTVLYALAVKNDSQTPGAILKLSDILRYVIYQSSSPTVTLRSELTILKDFIDLQRYRIHPSTQIDFAEFISDDDIQIAPMLMLPLLENSLKHGVHTETAEGFVRAKAMESEGTLQFFIVNSRSEGNKSTEGGFGLKNLRERLMLAYPGRYSLDISETPTTFAVSMEIKLK